MSSAMRAGGLFQRHQEGGECLDLEVRFDRVPQHGAAIAREGAVPVEIGFLEIETDAHVQHIPITAVLIGAAPGFRQID
ncbi:hypothetical protein D3C87_1730980 [compost metagenome]